MSQRTVQIGRFGAYMDAKISRVRRLKDQGRPQAMEAARTIVLENLTLSFSQSESPDGTKWPYTKNGKRRGEILIKTHLMKDSAFEAVSNARMDKDHLIFFFGQTSYGILHQRGRSMAYWLPQRQWYGVTAPQVAEIARAAAHEVAVAFISPP